MRWMKRKLKDNYPNFPVLYFMFFCMPFVAENISWAGNRKVFTGPFGFPDFVKAFSDGSHTYRVEDFTIYDADVLESYNIDFFIIGYLLKGDIESVMRFLSE